MKKVSYIILAVALLAVAVSLGSPRPALGATSSAFEQIVERYEHIRVALINDTTEGVAEKGKEIEDILDSYSATLSSTPQEAHSEKTAEIQRLLPGMSEAAGTLSQATSLDTARDAFYDLSKPLVRWRHWIDAEKPLVAYCPMAKRSWLQPEGELGNPYHGQSMLRCGEIVDD